MSATAVAVERLSPPRSAGRAPTGVSALTAARVIAFCALAFLAGARFATLLSHPPLGRALAVVALAGLCTAALQATRMPAAPGAALTAARAAIVLAALFAAMLAAGAPLQALWPWHWGHFERTVAHGLGALDGRWPYGGEVAPARLAVMLALPVTIVPAAALCFWPAARAGARARAGALALLLLLYTTGMANEPHAGWRVQGALLLLLLCAWGWAWRPRALEIAPALACVLALAIAAIMLAGALASGRPLVDYHAWNPFGTVYAPTSFDWNQTYRPLAWPKSNETMVEVASRTPQLWRATTLDRFDGVRFMRSAAPPAHAGLPEANINSRYLERTTFVLRGLHSTQLLSPGEVASASIQGTGLSDLAPIASDGSVRLTGAPPPSGDRYTVTSYVPRPSLLQLRASPPVFPTIYAPYIRFGLPAGAYTHGVSVTVTGADAGVIEASPYADVFRLARRLATGAQSVYEIVARVEAFLRRGFSYNESPPRSAYPLVSFLLSQRQGYCQQFSGAMTLLLRMDGVPARVAAGFLPGSLDRSTGLYRVSANDAHAWVEVFFAGIGWVAFDPTPPAPPERKGGLGGAETGAEAHRPALGASQTGGRAPRVAGGLGASGSGSDPLTALLTAAIVISLLLCAAYVLAGIRLRRAFAGDAAGAARELTRAFARAGRPLASGTTLAEIERQVGPRAGAYVRVLRERRYAGGTGALPSARERRFLRAALRGGRGPIARARALLALPPAALPARLNSSSSQSATRRKPTAA